MTMKKKHSLHLFLDLITPVSVSVSIYRAWELLLILKGQGPKGELTRKLRVLFLLLLSRSVCWGPLSFTRNWPITFENLVQRGSSLKRTMHICESGWKHEVGCGRWCEMREAPSSLASLHGGILWAKVWLRQPAARWCPPSPPSPRSLHINYQLRPHLGKYACM